MGKKKKYHTLAIKPIEVAYYICLFCGACVAICPTNAIFLNFSTIDMNPNLCTLCKRCMWVCPVGALSLAKESK